MKNVIVILADQHRQDCLGAYGNQEIRTPHIDGLAQDGTLYTNHFCCYPVCTPSRYSLLSGQYPHQHLGWSNHCTLPAGTPTFPAVLKAAGYRTAAVGKMHFTPTYLDVGFDTMILAEQDGPGRFDDDYHRHLMEHDLIDDIDITDQRREYRAHASPEYFASFGAAPSDLPEEFHSTSYITQKALGELEQWEEGTPHLLMVGYIKPHHPFDPPKRYADLYDPEKLTIPPGYTDAVPEVDLARHGGYFDHTTLSPERLKQVIALYYASITQIDDGVGAMIALLKEKGLYEDTLILYTSDHGDYLGFHHMLLKSNYMYDPLMKVPLIVKYPNQQKAECCGALSSNIDVAAVLLEACGVSPAETMSREGLSSREMVVGECYRNEYMVRSSQYKLLMSKGLTQMRFFDLNADPYELCDRANDPAYQTQLQQHRDFLIEELIFSHQSQVYLDYHAPTIRPVSHEEMVRQREPIMAYFERKTNAKPR